ncbi:saccharopine dehydrogenase [Alcanivorax sp. NBRC 101098]|uniref:saccharopine dehydrogenase family protein n=1 Tax=Alcanivorax sp. NBRC 101098 TaxID=1113728 RepID=UPI0004ABDE43|nr:saccharopine dehydrogenase NADP-binding domain-containing protein [Alcanivorax sp. NBRC 101098]BAP13161.1 saccharopine dehydrogenase [Alcanivorax sp. NBRC 101098]
MSDSQFDVVVFGASSFVGQILCQYLFDTYGANGELKWAAAGRSQNKLKRVKASLGDGASTLPLIIANANDADSLDALCAQTRVVVSTVGPYALYGEPMIKACVNSGTDYCDLTGEAQWIAEMLEKYETTAKKNGARIVHCCGFDSIPSDMGVYFLQQQSQARFNAPASTVHMRVKVAKGGVSGGTVASMMNIAEEAGKDPALRKKLADPYLLCPPDHGFKSRQNSIGLASYDDDFNAWVGPFVMDAINSRVVHRSNTLSGKAYSDHFIYSEAMLTGNGMGGRMKALGIGVGTGLFFVAAAVKPTRWVLNTFVMPQPGEGPSPEAQKAGFYDIRFVGHTDNSETLKVKVTGDADPGYGSTAKLLGQAAACLAQDVAEDAPGGFWTTATLLGEPLLKRLQDNAGMTFTVID